MRELLIWFVKFCVVVFGGIWASYTWLDNHIDIKVQASATQERTLRDTDLRYIDKRFDIVENMLKEVLRRR